MGKVKQADWNRTHGTYLTGRAYIDEADLTAAAMESRWGAGRLRFLVGPELREKFDRQRHKLNTAIWHGDLEAVRTEAGRMVKAWLALDKAADAAGAPKLSPLVWEVTLADGSVAVIVPDDEHAATVRASGRQLAVYTLEEIGRFLSAYPDVAKAKAVFPGATVTAINKRPHDPLDGIRDGGDLDDPLENLLTTFGA